MPTFLVLFGLYLLAVTVRGNAKSFLATVEKDLFIGEDFLAWIAAIALTYAIRFVPGARGVSNGLLVLIFLAMFLSKGGENTLASLKSTVTGAGNIQPVSNTDPTETVPSSGSESTTQSIGDALNSAGTSFNIPALNTIGGAVNSPNTGDMENVFSNGTSYLGQFFSPLYDGLTN